MVTCPYCEEQGISDSARYCPECGKQLPSGGCFIATACYGYDSGEVNILRRWRDNSLLTNKFGIRFVNSYYNYSPPIANFISNKPFIKKLIRISLKPIVSIIK